MYTDFLTAFIGVVDKFPAEKGSGAPIQNAGGDDILGVAKVLKDKYN